MNHRPRAQNRKSSSSPPPVSHPIWSYSPGTMSNPSLTQHSRYPLALGHSRPGQPRRHSAHHPRRYPDSSPNYASSSTALSSEGAGASSTSKGALKVLSSVKRSFSMNTTKKSGPLASFGGASTAEETAAAHIRLSDPDASRPPPTVQQIAAGFVTGLRPRTSSRPRAPPPSRSSLKKSTTSSTSTSSTVSLASTSLMSTRTGSTNTAATSVASSRRTRPRFSLKDAIFGRSGAPVTPISTVSRKAVRFHVDRSPNAHSTPLPS